MKETSSNFQYHRISIKFDMYAILPTTSIHLLYDFSHVYREHNMSVDHLSKETLNMKAGLLSLSRLLEGEIIAEGMIQLF